MNDKARSAINSDIEKFGWHVIKVSCEPNLPDFAYTVGLYKSFKSPEVIIFGAPLDFMHQVLNAVGVAVRHGSVFQTDKPYEGIISGHKCKFQTFPQSQFRSHLGGALAFYQGDAFPALQCFWPDASG